MTVAFTYNLALDICTSGEAHLLRLGVPGVGAVQTPNFGSVALRFQGGPLETLFQALYELRQTRSKTASPCSAWL